VGLPEMTVLAGDAIPAEPVIVHVEAAGDRPWCHRCGGGSRVKECEQALFVGLPCFGRPAPLVRQELRLCRPHSVCEMGTWTREDPRVAQPRQVMTGRTGRWATLQVGRDGRSVWG
jgi:transposase